MLKIFLSPKKIWSNKQKYLGKFLILNSVQGNNDLLLCLKSSMDSQTH